MRIAQQLAAFSDEVQLFNLRGLNRDDHSPVKDLFGPYEFLVGKSKPNLPSRKGGRVHVVAKEIGNRGATGDSNTIRIGREDVHMNTYIWGISGVTVAGGVGVIIDSKGHLGTVVSSERFKDEIKPMDRDEDVEKLNPALVARNAEGKVFTVPYEAVNAMLLNEFLKEHRRAFEIALVLVRFDYVARVVINASDGPMWVTPTAHDEILPENVRLIRFA